MTSQASRQQAWTAQAARIGQAAQAIQEAARMAREDEDTGGIAGIPAQQATIRAATRIMRPSSVIRLAIAAQAAIGQDGIATQIVSEAVQDGNRSYRAGYALLDAWRIARDAAGIA